MTRQLDIRRAEVKLKWVLETLQPGLQLFQLSSKETCPCQRTLINVDEEAPAIRGGRWPHTVTASSAP